MCYTYVYIQLLICKILFDSAIYSYNIVHRIINLQYDCIYEDFVMNIKKKEYIIS